MSLFDTPKTSVSGGNRQRISSLSFVKYSRTLQGYFLCLRIDITTLFNVFITKKFQDKLLRQTAKRFCLLSAGKPSPWGQVSDFRRQSAPSISADFPWSVSWSVIQANGMMEFDNDLRTGVFYGGCWCHCVNSIKQAQYQLQYPLEVQFCLKGVVIKWTPCQTKLQPAWFQASVVLNCSCYVPLLRRSHNAELHSF